MIKRYNQAVSSLSKLFDNLAAISLFIMMILVISNVLLRATGKPIQLTFDFVEFLTAIAIGLSLAFCAVKDGHISISLLMERLPKKVQKAVDIVIRMISLVFLGFVTWQMGSYGYTKYLAGEVAVTTGLPYAPFIFIISIGFGILTLVTLGKLLALFINADGRAE